MKIHLVFAPPESPGSLAEMSEGVMPPLGILYLAAYLRERIPDLEIKITDGLRTGYKATVKEIIDFKPQILGVSISTPCALSAYSLINTVKERLPHTFVAAGGAHVTALAKECLEKSKADVVVLGEGEETFSEIVSSLADGKRPDPATLEGIQGIACRDGMTVVATKTRPYLPSLDRIPFPARDLIPMKDYQGWYLTKKPPDTSVIFSRGCAYHCTFCSNKVWNISEPRVRFRSGENIADEMELLRMEYGIREVFDNSDEFNSSLTHAKEVCRALIKRNLGMAWKTQLRARPLDEELVSLLAESGCWYVHLGIESGNNRTLRGIRKGVTAEEAEAACALLKKHNIRIMALFMLFNVWEEGDALGYEDAALTQRTLDFAGELYRKRLIDYLGWSVTQPYPGSPLYDIARKHDLIKPELAGNWDRWVNEEFSVMRLPGVPDRDIARLKTKGSVLRAKCLLRSGGFGLKDAVYMIKKGLRVVKNEISGPKKRNISL